MVKELNLPEMFKETPLKFVLEALELGKNHLTISEPVGKDEIVIGELSDFEIAVWMAKSTLCEKFNALIKEARNGGKEVDNFTAFMGKETYELLNALLWNSIKTRIGEPSFQGDGIGVREGFKIVSRPKNNNGADDIISMLTRSLSLPGMPGVSIVGVGHNCADCDNYDECNLPEKVARA